MFFKIVIKHFYFLNTLENNLIYKHKKIDLDASYLNIILMQVTASYMGYKWLPYTIKLLSWQHHT